MIHRWCPRERLVVAIPRKLWNCGTCGAMLEPLDSGDDARPTGTRDLLDYLKDVYAEFDG